MAVIPFDPPYPKTPYYTQNSWLYHSVIEPELWSIEILHCGNSDFRPFCSCDLDLNLMIFIHKRDPYSLEIYRMCKYELPTSMSSKVIVLQTDRQTDRQIDRQTNRHDRNYMPGSFASVEKCQNRLVEFSLLSNKSKSVVADVTWGLCPYRRPPETAKDYSLAGSRR